MKAKTVTCLITLGPMSIVPKRVWAWEAEVLKEKFGGQCEFSETGETNISELPNAESEFSRLEAAYGVDEETKVSHAVNTFGRGKRGFRELEKAIQDSEVKPKPATKVSDTKSEKTGSKAKPKKPGPKPKDAPDTAKNEGDPLE